MASTLNLAGAGQLRHGGTLEQLQRMNTDDVTDVEEMPQLDLHVAALTMG
jgi:hypothetical protein